MTPEDRQLIGDLFDRMRDTGLSEKDREAEAFINQSVRATPDATYKLVQSVLIQENALQEAGARMEDLEARVRELEDQLAQSQPRQQSSGGSFLGGLFGSKPQPPAARSASVPSVGQQRYDQPMGSPWGRQEAPPPPAYGQGGYGQPQPAPQRSGGGFMKTAAATAAGVAGGMLAAGAIRDMMGGGGAHAAGRHGDTNSGERSPYEVTADDSHPQQQEVAYEDDSSDSDSSFDSGDSGGDNDI